MTPDQLIPLPVPSGAPEENRRLTILGIGHAEGWFNYVRPEGDTLAERRYVVEIATPLGRVDRVLLPDEVLPWVLGLADSHGRAELVAYRPGLT